MLKKVITNIIIKETSMQKSLKMTLKKKTSAKTLEKKINNLIQWRHIIMFNIINNIIIINLIKLFNNNNDLTKNIDIPSNKLM